MPVNLRCAFSKRKTDLSQVSSCRFDFVITMKLSHQIAMQQMRGGFSNEIAN
jgi:hypothetical protein